MKSEQNKAMGFEAFVYMYLEATSTKINTKSYTNKKSILKKFILPYFGDMKLSEITPRDIEEWLSAVSRTIDPKTGRPYTKSYVKTINSHMRAIMNYAEKRHDFKSNPDAAKESPDNIEESDEMTWSPEQYRKFSETMMEKPLFFYLFEVMYWCGLTESELMSLAVDDVDLSKKEISVTKTLLPRNRNENNDTSKSMHSRRIVSIPDFLRNELEDYMDYIHRPANEGRLFPVSELDLIYTLKKGAEKACIPEITVSGIRLSHIELLADQGFSIPAVTAGEGYRDVDADLYNPDRPKHEQIEIADRLNDIKRGWFE